MKSLNFSFRIQNSLEIPCRNVIFEKKLNQQVHELFFPNKSYRKIYISWFFAKYKTLIFVNS